MTPADVEALRVIAAVWTALLAIMAVQTWRDRQNFKRRFSTWRDGNGI
jgi:hypothetical protein